MFALIIDVSSLSSEAKENMVVAIIKEVGSVEDNNSVKQVAVHSNSVSEINKVALIAYDWIDEITH